MVGAPTVGGLIAGLAYCKDVHCMVNIELLSGYIQSCVTLSGPVVQLVYFKNPQCMEKALRSHQPVLQQV